MVDRERNYFVPNNAGSIHNRDTAPLLIGRAHKKSVFKFFEIIKTNWQIFFYSFTIIITLCGELIFRKSLSTIMYNYRWFVLILLNLLSFLFYLLVILYKKYVIFRIAYAKRKAKEQKRKKEKANHILNDNDDLKSDLNDTNSDLISNISFMSDTNELESDNKAELSRKKRNEYLHWRAYLIISFLDSLHMIFIFIPIGVLPANIVMCIPLIGLSIFSLFHCCLSCDNQYIKLGIDNIFGCLLLFLSILLLIFQDSSTSMYLTDNDLNYDKKYISNLILFFIGCFLLLFNDMYKRISLSKTKIDMIEFNLIQSVLSVIFLFVLSPLAFQIQYISKYDGEESHITSIAHSFENIEYGFECLFGGNTYQSDVKDGCEHITLAYPIMHFVLLLLFIILNRLSQNRLFQNKTYLKRIKNKNSFIQHLISVSIVLSFSFCYFQSIQDLWNNENNNGMYQIHLRMDWETPIIIVLLSIGAFLSFRKIDERNVSIKLLEDEWIIS